MAMHSYVTISYAETVNPLLPSVGDLQQCLFLFQLLSSYKAIIEMSEDSTEVETTFRSLIKSLAAVSLYSISFIVPFIAKWLQARDVCSDIP